MVKQLSSVVLSACMLLTMSACAPLGQGIKSFDQSKIVLMQTEQMVAGEDIAVVETSQGDFKMRFFPSEAPKTVAVSYTHLDVYKRQHQRRKL